MKAPDPILAELGWKPFFGDQVSDEEKNTCQPVRVMSVHRGTVTVSGKEVERSISSKMTDPSGPEDRPTVGDWLLINRDTQSIVRILARTSLFKRAAPGNDRRLQLIAANVDTLFVVTSCNQDFNVARIERYLVLANEVGVRPIVVLTKADLSPDPERFVGAASALQKDLEVVLVNGREFASVSPLTAYCRAGETAALVGSSGVGKSTLVNTLIGSQDIATQAVRESDGKGLHTTTVREMHRLLSGSNGGGWLVDTPGMRELQMSEVHAGVAEVFDDVVAITLDCRFTNCAHADEPRCAIQAAFAAGTLGVARFERWRKLMDEDIVNTHAVALRRVRDRKVSKRNMARG